MINFPSIARISTDEKTQMSTEKKLLYENLTYRIRGALYEVHKALGPVHKEAVYHSAIAIELKRLKISFETEKVLKVTYRGETVGIYKPDFITSSF